MRTACPPLVVSFAKLWKLMSLPYTVYVMSVMIRSKQVISKILILYVSGDNASMWSEICAKGSQGW